MTTQQFTPEQVKEMIEEAIKDPGEFAKVFGNIPPPILLHLNSLLIVVLLNQAKITDAALFKLMQEIVPKQQGQESKD